MWKQRKFGFDRGIYGIEEKSDNEDYSSLTISLPGLAQTMSERGYLFSLLRKRLALANKHMIQFDYRGHGDSLGCFRDVTIRSMIQDAFEVIEGVIHDKPPDQLFLVGHALGTLIAHGVARRLREKGYGSCELILISPISGLFPSYRHVFEKEALAHLDQHKFIDFKRLCPGDHYHSLDDFSEKQICYLGRLGGHIQNLHGLSISKNFLEEIDEWRLRDIDQARTTIICGELDELNCQKLLVRASRHTLLGVKYYYDHPRTVDETIELIGQYIDQF